MKIRIAYLVLFGILCLFIGCGQKTDETGEQKSQKGKRQFLSVGTAPPGGTFFVIGGAMAGVVNDNRGDLDWQVTAESTSGTQENIRRLVRKELDFSLANAAISYFAVRGEEQWGQPH